MPDAFDYIAYRYHPVGQGLFVSSALIKQGGEGPKFRWIYDCGSNSGGSFIDREIDEMPWLSWESSPRNAPIELVTISHFDHDHISGLAKLLARFPIDTLVLPYAPLASRLILAFEQRVGAGDPLFGLFVDPIGYIRSLDGGGRIRRIVLVPPSNGETPSPLPEEPDAPRSPEGEERTARIELRIEADELDGETSADLMIGAGDGASVAMLRQGGRLWLDGLWEFVPYNNADPLPGDLAAFLSDVDLRRDLLLQAAQKWRSGFGLETDIANAITALKDHYDDKIGSDPKARNLISLFLYSGPLFKLPNSRFHRSLTVIDNASAYHSVGLDRIAQLFSGDGYLDTPGRMADLEKHLTRRRLDRVGIFQVMHHGASGNWHSGVAAKLRPDVSIFSSDPDRGNTYHPRAEVLRDFWAFRPIQVDKSNGCSVRIHVSP